MADGRSQRTVENHHGLVPSGTRAEEQKPTLEGIQGRRCVRREMGKAESFGTLAFASVAGTPSIPLRAEVVTQTGYTLAYIRIFLIAHCRTITALDWGCFFGTAQLLVQAVENRLGDIIIGTVVDDLTVHALHQGLGIV